MCFVYKCAFIKYFYLISIQFLFHLYDNQISEFYVIPSVIQKKESYGFRITEMCYFYTIYSALLQYLTTFLISFYSYIFSIF